MSGSVGIFVNEKNLTVASGTTAGQAVETFDQALGQALSKGSGYLTDGVGRKLAPETIVIEGMIIRVVSPRPRNE